MSEEIRLKIHELVGEAAGRFREAGFASPREESEVLLAHLLGKERLYLYLNSGEEVSECSSFRMMVALRLTHIPLEYITQEAQFMDLTLQITGDVMVPRPETELLVETCLSHLRDCEGPLVVDMCTGSGNIAIALGSYLGGASVYACDISISALRLARGNARACGLRNVFFRQGDMFGAFMRDNLEGNVDLLISNPPYIRSFDFAGLPPEVSCFEPRLALDGGADGLDFYRVMSREAPRFLKAGARVALEVGAGQAASVAKILEKEHFHLLEIIKDYSGIERIVSAEVF